MRPRIRTIKPELWSSSDVMELTPLGKLAWIALISLSDDEGRLKTDVRHLDAVALRSGALSELQAQLDLMEDRGMIHQWTDDHASYIAVLNWKEHQKINRPSPSTLPEPPSGELHESHGAFSETSRPRARPRIGSDRIGSELRSSTAPPTQRPPARARAHEGFGSHEPEDDLVVAVAKRYEQRAGHPVSATGLEWLRKALFACSRLDATTACAAIDDVADKHIAKGKPVPDITYWAGRFADLDHRAADNGAALRSRPGRGRGMTHIGNLLGGQP